MKIFNLKKRKSKDFNTELNKTLILEENSMDYLVERIVERTEKYVDREITDSFKKMEEVLDYYREVIKTANSSYDGYELLDKLELVKKEVGELCIAIRNSSADVKKYLRNTEKEKE